MPEGAEASLEPPLNAISSFQLNTEAADAGT
jgi:hypothetical protein